MRHLQRLGKEHLFVLNVAEDEMHENDAAHAIAKALMGNGVNIQGEPTEGKINIVADKDGLLKINREALFAFNMLGDVMCATLHDNSFVKKDQVVAGARAIPLVVKRAVVDDAVMIAEKARKVERRGHSAEGIAQNQTPSALLHAPCESASGLIEVKELRKPKAGIVITGNEVYHGRVQDAFAPIIAKKIEACGGKIVGTYYAPDDVTFIEERLRELLKAGADLLITTGGMSVDPDDVTRFAIRNLGATDLTYGSAVLPGAMFLVGYLGIEHSAESIEHSAKGMGQEPSALCTLHSAAIPILGIPACGMYHKVTIFDLILPRILAGERIGRKELAELGHGGLCLNCKECRYPVCPFGK